MQFWRRLESNVYWAYRAVIAHPLRRLLQPNPSQGLRRFLANYAVEGLLPMTAEDHEVLQGASRCIHCGVCDPFGPLPEGSFQGVSLLPVAYSRATPHLVNLEGALSNLRPESLERAEAVCPTRVPLRALAAYLQRKLVESKRGAG